MLQKTVLFNEKSNATSKHPKKPLLKKKKLVSIQESMYYKKSRILKFIKP